MPSTAPKHVGRIVAGAIDPAAAYRRVQEYDLTDLAYSEAILASGALPRHLPPYCC